MNQEYQEPFVDYEDLATILQGKGLKGERAIITKRIRDVGYKRLSAYWFSFFNHQSKSLVCSIDDVWSLYCFDRQLRFLLLDAIERIEVGIRARLVHYFTELYGPFGYLNPSHFHEQSMEKWLDWNVRQLKQARRSMNSKGSAASTFSHCYSNQHLPLWVLSELMDFGSTVTLYRMVDKQVKVKISKELGLPKHEILDSWLAVLNDVRNACAHHEKVWNRQWAKRPQLPKRESLWQLVFSLNTGMWVDGITDEASFKENRTGMMLSICHYMLSYYASSSAWTSRFMNLIHSQQIPLSIHTHMGFPEQWESHPLWSDAHYS
ncbi:MAG: Abi family protein [Akkermansia sp.]